MTRRPQVVAEAIYNDDTSLLRQLGRAGGIATRNARRKKAVRADVEASADAFRLERELVALRRSTNEDVLDADGNDVGET